MNEKQVIKKLYLIKSVKPDDMTLRLIRKQIASPISTTKNFSLEKWFAKKRLIPLYALASFIIIFTIAVLLFSNLLEEIVISARIALASNHYEKAKIALAHVQGQADSLHNSYSKSNVSELSKSLALANTEMSGLQLIGERGKYSSYQCKELYESYHKDLQSIENTTDKNGKFGSLISQAEEYDKQATLKLKNYKYNMWQSGEKK